MHLHPDLQERLTCFLKGLVENKSAIIILTTHSTAILGALADHEDAHIVFMSSGQKELDFKKITDQHKKIIPIFGAHPLSNMFNKAPIFLVEGEDDERIWQQAIRSSNRALKIYPCSTNGISNMNSFENEIEAILSSIYDNPIAYSLRDRDEGDENINDLKYIKRAKLSCRSAENLLLTDEVLASLKTTWENIEQSINNWLERNKDHIH